MKLFDYSELIRVIDNVEVREEREKVLEVLNLKEKSEKLERSLIESGILDDWNRLKQLCNRAKVRLCVSHLAEYSIGCVLGVGDFTYCNLYNDDGSIKKFMSSGSSWRDDYGFIYRQDEGVIWKTWHTSTFHIFDGFGENEKSKYETRIYMLETFRDTYEHYRMFQLQKIADKFESRVKVEDILK